MDFGNTINPLEAAMFLEHMAQFFSRMDSDEGNRHSAIALEIVDLIYIMDEKLKLMGQ